MGADEAVRPRLKMIYANTRTTVDPTKREKGRGPFSRTPALGLSAASLHALDGAKKGSNPTALIG